MMKRTISQEWHVAINKHHSGKIGSPELNGGASTATAWTLHANKGMCRTVTPDHDDFRVLYMSNQKAILRSNAGRR